MRKRCLVVAVFIAVLVSCLSVSVASGAMRNLLTEFQAAVREEDLEKVNSLLREGFNAQDGVPIVINFIKGNSNTKEEFCVSLIRTLANARVKFKRIRPDEFKNNKILKELLDAGLDPDYVSDAADDKKLYGNKEDKTLLFEILSKRSISEEDLERLQLLVEHKASLNTGGKLWLGQTDALYYFLRERNLEYERNFTEENVEQILLVIKVLHKGNVATEEAQKYLKELRKQYRNVPEALKYLDNIEHTVSGSWWQNLLKF